MRRTGAAILCILLLCSFLSAGFAAKGKTDAAGAKKEKTAREIKPEKYTSEVNPSRLSALFDRSYFTAWYAKRGWIQIDLPKNKPAYMIYICFYKKTVPVVIQVPDKNGRYRDEVTVDDPYLHQTVRLPGVTSVRIRIADESKKEILYLAELYFFGQGSKPAWVQTWRTAKKADLLLLSGHPDDELLWFGGTLPYYAGERGLHVQVVYMTHGDTWRQNELLDGLWKCGVRDYPVISGFADRRTDSSEEIFKAWGGGKKSVFPWLVRIIRRLKPGVMLTHARDGEYGHGVHRAAWTAAIQCYELAADRSFDPNSAKKYGIWQVKKLYIHQHPENRIVMDWSQPLKAFGGRTGIEAADEALKCHKSQQPITYAANWRIPYDCREFGLYATEVGPDILKNDFMENIETASPGKR